MFVEPSIPLTRVALIDDPSRQLSFVVVPTDSEPEFALEGPDPSQDFAWTRTTLSREQLQNAESFLRTLSPVKSPMDLWSLSLYARTWNFVWSVSRHWHGDTVVDLTHHATLASAKRRYDMLEVAFKSGSGDWTPPYRDVVATVHRVER